MDWIESLTLGAVQGLTEFLPVSSDGHLAVTQQVFARLRGHARPAAEDVFFDVMLHVGTLAAILIFYRRAISNGLRGLSGPSDVPAGFQRDQVLRVGLLAIVATLPLVPDALFLKKWIDQAFQSPIAAGLGFLASAAILMLTQWFPGSNQGKGPGETTWLDALLIGLAQACAPLPGVSRSGLTIAAGLFLGLSRTWAVGFSLLMAVPAILGATVFELRKVDTQSLDADRVAQIVAATILAGLIGFYAITFLVRIVRSGRIWYFSVYLLLAGLVVLATLGRTGPEGGRDGGETPALDRAGGPGPDVLEAPAVAGGPQPQPLAGPHQRQPRPRAAGPGAPRD